MISFDVPDMSCGHCVAAITKAVKEVDPEANVQIDLATHVVQIEAKYADAADFATAIADAGYSPNQRAR